MKRCVIVMDKRKGDKEFPSATACAVALNTLLETTDFNQKMTTDFNQYKCHRIQPISKMQ